MRVIVSAEMDGEATPGEVARVERHLASCAECRQWAGDARRATRRVVVTAATSAPDVTSAVFAAAPHAARQIPLMSWFARTSLVSLALVQIYLAFAGFAHGAHHVRELGAFDLALAVAVLAVALQPRRAEGLLPLLGALAVILLAVATRDALGDRVEIWQEAPHLVVVLEFAVVAWVRRLSASTGTPPPAPHKRPKDELRSAA